MILDLFQNIENKMMILMIDIQLDYCDALLKFLPFGLLNHLFYI